MSKIVKGDRHARRDVITLADKLGVDLLAGRQQAFEEALAANHKPVLQTCVQRQYDKMGVPVFAPPELLDDDAQGQNQH